MTAAGDDAATTRTPPRLPLEVLPWTLGVCRLAPDVPLPAWALDGGAFFTVSRTPDELSITCEESRIPDAQAREGDYRAIRVAGPLPFDLLGVFASISGPLADAGISIFAISTFDTDYVLVRQRDLDMSLDVLRRAGHRIA